MLCCANVPWQRTRPAASHKSPSCPAILSTHFVFLFILLIKLCKCHAIWQQDARMCLVTSLPAISLGHVSLPYCVLYIVSLQVLPNRCLVLHLPAVVSSDIDLSYCLECLAIYCMSAGATNHVLTALVASFDHDPSAMLTCLVPLPLKSNLRHCALVYLQSAVKVTDTASYSNYVVLFSMAFMISAGDVLG